MVIKCINQADFKAITTGRDYVVINDLGEFYEIENDYNKFRNYAKRYFEVIPEPIIEDVDEVGVIEEEEKDDIIIVEYVNGSGIEMSVNGETINLNYHSVAGNCGVYSFNGVNYLFDLCGSKELFRKAILSIIEVFKGSNNGCMLIFSTNDEMYEIWEVLDEVMDTQSEAVNNPNSNMDVKLWIKYAYNDKPDYDEDDDGLEIF